MCFQSGEYAHFHTESRSFRHELHGKGSVLVSFQIKFILIFALKAVD